MSYTVSFGWTGTIGNVVLGATKSEGGTRKVSYTIGGGTTLPFLEPVLSRSPLIAFEICDNPVFWSPIVRDYCGDLVKNPAEWARTAEASYGADLVRLHLSSTRIRNFSDIGAIGKTVEDVLRATALPLIIEGSNEPKIDSEVFQKCGETGQGERLLLGTAEAGRYRSIAAAALAYNHSIVAQSPIDINLAKQLNILLREIGVQRDHIVVDPYTGSLGYGFEYSYSAMERIRFSALKGDADLAMPMICSAADTLTIKEVREAGPELQDEMAVSWEFYTGLAAAAAGAEIICVRHPKSIPLLREAFDDMQKAGGMGGLWIMALKALDIYKLLPKKNCKECGDPTCLTFAMKLAGGKADVDLCPYLDENAKAVLGATTRPPIRLVKIGVGERSFRVGEETVLYRHEKTFYHPPGIMFKVSDLQTDAEIAAVTRRVRDEIFTRVGSDLKFSGIAIENASGSPEIFARAVAIVEHEQAHLPPVLVSKNPAASAAALVHCGGYRPLLHAATRGNFKEMCALAKQHGCPMVIQAPDLDGLVQLAKDCTAAGAQDLVMDLAPESLGAFLTRSTEIRQLAITRTVPELGYPVYLDTTGTGQTDAALALGIVKFASVIVTPPLPPGSAKASLTLRQNIYTDPQKPIQMNPGLYRVGTPDKNAPVLMTVNFSLTFFTLQGYLESTRIPCYMLIVDTEGLSVLTAVAAGKLSEMLVRDSLKKFDVENEVSHRKLIIPGYASPLSGRIQDATGWKILVGPRDAAEIGDYLNDEWKKESSA